jgi:hypothetical protein
MKFDTIKASTVNSFDPNLISRIRKIYIKNLILDEKIDNLPLLLKNITIRNYTEKEHWDYFITGQSELVSFFINNNNIHTVIKKIPFGCSFTYLEGGTKKQVWITRNDL